MSPQFVDLFDHQKYGFNYRAIVFLFLGSLISWVLAGGWQLAAAAVAGHTVHMTWSDGFWMLGDFAVYTCAIVACLHVLKSDLLLPVAIGICIALWHVTKSITGISSQPELSVISVLMKTAWPLLVFGGLAITYRILDNKLGAIILAYVVGSLLAVSVLILVRSGTETPVESYLQNGSASMLGGFVEAVFLYTGIALHFQNQDVSFDEFGVSSPAGMDSADQIQESPGKVRSPLTMMLLAAVTLNIYVCVWLYRIYAEVRAHEPHATTITPGKAIGFLFIPIFNLYWVVRLFIDVPRAIEALQKDHPPTGKTPNRWLITCLLLASAPVAIICASLEQNEILLALNPLLLWWGMLLAQSSLNSHWRIHARN